MSRKIIETDVVVAGSGMAGLVAAARALDSGVDVIVLEKGNRAGGTTIVTGGYLRVDEGKQPSIAPYEPLDDGVAWLADLGVTVSDPPAAWQEGMRRSPTERAKVIEPPDFVERMVTVIEERGGEFRFRTSMKELLPGTNNEVVGVVAHGEGAELFEIHAPSVILATGDYSGNSELVERYLGQSVEHIWLRRDPRSTGDGFIAARAVGAKTTGNLSRIDGHCMVAPPAEFTMEQFRDATQYYSPRSIALTTEGERFTDESLDFHENRLVETALQRGLECLYYVIDADLYDRVWPHEHVGTRVENAKRFGGTVVEGDSLDAFGAALTEAGVDGRRAVRTIQQFNDAVRTDDGAALDPPRRALQFPIETPPFYAVKVQPGISFFYGGLDVDHHARVVCRSNSTSTVPQMVKRMDEVSFEPIEGLYAAGVEVGRPERHGYYEAGLSLGLATGRIAGEHAALRAAGGS